MRLAGFSYSQVQKRAADLLDRKINLSANELSIGKNGVDIVARDTALSFSIERLSASAISDWENLINNSKGANLQTNLVAVLPYLLKNSPSISDVDAKFTIKAPDASGAFAFNANLSIDAQGLIPETATLREYQNRITFRSKLSGSTSLLSRFLEIDGRERKEREVKTALSQGKQVSEEEAKAHVAKARPEAEELIAELGKEGVLIISGDQYAIGLDYTDKHWSINGQQGDQHVAEFMVGLKEIKPVAAEPQTESPMDRAIRSNSELHAQSYPNQIKAIKEWIQGGQVSTSSFRPMVFHEVGLMRAFLQRKQVRDAPGTVNNTLRDHEVWWIDGNGFYFYLANITNGVLTGIAYQLDLGSDCSGQPKGPFFYYLIQFDPPLQPASARVVRMPKQEEVTRQAQGKIICGTLVTAW